jgi:TusA-related sulfurtransferase
MIKADKTLDIQGIAGERVRMIALQTLGPMEAGQVLKLITSERNAQEGIALLCREMGYTLLDQARDGSRYFSVVQR